MKTIRWGAFGTVLWGVALFALMLLMQIVVMVVWYVLNGKTLTKGFDPTDLNNGNAVSAITFIADLVCGLALVGVIKLKKGTKIADYLCLNAVPSTFWRKQLIWLALLIVYLIIGESISRLANIDFGGEFSSAITQTAKPLWLLFFAVVVIAPLFEELFFRGFLLNGLKNSAIGTHGAIILTALFWAGIHVQYNLFAIAMIFALGLIFGYAKERSGSLWLTIALHAFNNALALGSALIWP